MGITSFSKVFVLIGFEVSFTRTVKRNCLQTRCNDEVEEMEAHTNAVCKAADGWTHRADIKCYEI
jgi:hypothetical protein